MQTQKLPPLLCRYVSFRDEFVEGADGSPAKVNFTRQLLENQQLFCQRITEFDDVHDGATGPFPSGLETDIDRYFVERMAPLGEGMSELGWGSISEVKAGKSEKVDAALRHIGGQDQRKGKRILCLATKCDNEVLWASYADRSRGLCLVFDTGCSPFCRARPVDYACRPHPISETDSEKPIFRKSKAWKWQEEWRIVTDEEFLSFQKESLRKIVLGYKFDRTRFEDLMSVLCENNFRVDVLQVNRSRESFDFGIVPLRCIGSKAS